MSDQVEFATASQTAPEVIISLNHITTALAAHGIAKGQKNATQGWMFRGVDDAQKALAPLLAKYKLIITTDVKDSIMTQVPTRSGGVQHHSIVKVKYTFHSAIDGSRVSSVIKGESMDSGDKSIAQAMSVAFKMMVFQNFSVPIQGVDDPDKFVHEITTGEPMPPPPPRYTQEEYNAFHASIADGKPWDFYNLFSGMDVEVKMDLGATLPKGKITATKKIMAEWISECTEEIKSAAIQLQHLLDKNDEDGANEILEEIPLKYLLKHTPPELSAWISELDRDANLESGGPEMIKETT
jgi:hypothetical protein